jgi:hypothetical protein
MTNAQRNKPFDLDDLLHPEQAFDHPHDVVNDTDLTLNEKRAILASWASDACAVEAAPALRQAPVANASCRWMKSWRPCRLSISRSTPT